MTTGMPDNSIPGLAIDQYREQVKLDEPYEPAFSRISSDKERIDIVDALLDILINHEGLAEPDQLPDEYEQKRQLVRALLNVRPPDPLDTTFLKNISLLLLFRQEFLDLLSKDY